MADLEMLKQFSIANGISGYEKHITRLMKTYLEEYADDIQYDG